MTLSYQEMSWKSREESEKELELSRCLPEVLSVSVI